ncbi:MAG: glycosyltransferase [Xanthobacteraceae bacterium]|nr:glycosyltransferase [Xanthobacteraceae bacterium]
MSTANESGRPISFIVPAFNCQDTVVESVRSILEDNLCANDEIIVVDDGSTDKTAIILAELAASIQAIRIVTHDRNRGGGAARNTAVAAARHELVFCLDSDNLLVPGAVAALRFGIGEADAATFREARFFGHGRRRVTSRWRYRPGVSSLADLLAGHVHPASSGNYLFKRSSWQRAGGYPELAGALDTWGFGLRQLATGQRMIIFSGRALSAPSRPSIVLGPRFKRYDPGLDERFEAIGTIH